MKSDEEDVLMATGMQPATTFHNINITLKFMVLMASTVKDLPTIV